MTDTVNHPSGDETVETTFAPLEQVAGVKHDTGKPRWDLLPPDALDEVAKVLSFGAKKYAQRNWELGMDWGRLVAAQMRHLAAWQQGVETDEETGLSHLAHASCCALMLQALAMRGDGKDDRPTIRKAGREIARLEGEGDGPSTQQEFDEESAGDPDWFFGLKRTPDYISQADLDELKNRAAEQMAGEEWVTVDDADDDPEWKASLQRFFSTPEHMSSEHIDRQKAADSQPAPHEYTKEEFERMGFDCVVAKGAMKTGFLPFSCMKWDRTPQRTGFWGDQLLDFSDAGRAALQEMIKQYGELHD